ncbi:MAG: alanine racemase [Candidatus Cloacimonadota bacterium]|nr:MAG: alanine racemase [Candidatus Cloacimonadota bacterium]
MNNSGFTERSRVEINLTDFENNFKYLKTLLKPDTKIMQIVKADAYGHGAYEISKTAEMSGADFLGVANAEEGRVLRYRGLTLPILILSPSLPDEIPFIVENNLTPTVHNTEFLEELSRKSSKLFPVHINVNTGMGRSGIKFEDYFKLEEKIKNLKNIKLEGVYSHFAESESDNEFTSEQSAKFTEFVNSLALKPEFIHLANSFGIINNSDNICNMVRFGILSYGINTASDKNLNGKIKQVMSFYSAVSAINLIKKGETVGYGRTYKAESDIKSAVIPVGYADGYDFLLSNKGKAIINNKLCKVIGRVSMDMLTVDVSEIENPQIGDEVLLLGDAPDVNFVNTAKKYGGSAYESACQIGRRAKRFYLKNNKIVEDEPLSRRNFISKDFSDKKLDNIIESAVRQRLQSSETAEIAYRYFLKQLFADKDNNIQYRSNFKHTVEFSDEDKTGDFYRVKTSLSFRKKPLYDNFVIACASDSSALEKYFNMRNCEYRWLLDSGLNISEDNFKLISVKINEIKMNVTRKNENNSLIFECSSPLLRNFIGKEVEFNIKTTTYYPKKSHQLTIFCNEITKGFQVKFKFPENMKVEVSSVFSGKVKFPKTIRTDSSIEVISGKENWVLPNSGIIFGY